MDLLIHLFAALGAFAFAILLIVAAAVGLAFAGGCLGASISCALYNGNEDRGVGKGLLAGCLVGIFLTLYCIFAYSLGTAFLVDLGLGVAALCLAGLIALVCSNGGSLPEDYPY